MSLYDEIDMRDFVNTLTEKTKNSEIAWKKVPKQFYNKLIDRPVTDSNIKDSFYSDSNNGRVVIGKFQRKVFYEDDLHFLEDHFFITITNNNFDDPTTFLETDEENPLGFSFTVLISKLHRLIQISTNDIKNRIQNWFD